MIGAAATYPLLLGPFRTPDRISATKRASVGPMPDFDTILFGAVVVLVCGVGFLFAVEGWRRWAEYRRLRKHFRH
jgi:hypothetical protein